ncbi:MAG: phosphoribosylaminoimidazolesuccinocarboxamide synthase [Pseudomonadales bacterium]|nr:phosphoribosylaminoimidazolesuccinocarboxamide synthase [Pseudomonadales bacterium]MBO6594304.1 phosphoribosylaminoimidazolesuccinocarboxamide synthase [Pseudomonadales bacterium]MBO6700805.1 phosphoribosylaminoimidazolesuccinocarboxamide synthase [Pseudomonadales bacterium]MBO6822135.1 phosphoribosylaminoimidazolesuccinocarboxamide synthase [Pseudomonadales bacterium]MBO7004875.1 phosphoribosylaminoimidazolesuccinocarboxamide synthase [Pseudomonadales bacterium]
MDALLTTDLPLPNRRVGKVRDVYDVELPDGGDGVLIVASDRVSVFDVVLANGIPGKGKLLTRLSRFWFEFLTDEFDHHLVSTNPRDIPGLSDADYVALEGRIMICRKTRVVPIECIVRGYLTGSGYKEYLAEGSVCGISLPGGMVNSDKIESPIFTPSTKAEEGHDENISFDEACEQVGVETMTAIRQTAMNVYLRGRDYALERGIIIADTKFEFGWTADNQLLLIDEVLTPDSSRFWPADEWQPGQEQNSFDKQYVRNYTEELVSQGRWDKTEPGPELPDEIIENTLARYEEAINRLAS